MVTARVCVLIVIVVGPLGSLMVTPAYAQAIGMDRQLDGGTHEARKLSWRTKVETSP
jgi:hypothetical protein